MNLENVKWNKSDRKRQILYGFTYIWNLQNRKNKQCRQEEIITDTENKQTVARGKEGVGEKLVRDFKRYNASSRKKKKW